MNRVILLTAALILIPAPQAPALSLPAAKLPGLLPLLQVAGQLLEFADAATTQEGVPTVEAPRGPRFEAVELRVVYRVPSVAVTDYVTNEVLGLELPGRRVTAAIRTDLLVYFTLDASKLRLRQDPDYADTVEVVLPLPKVTVGFPEGEQADFTVDYAALRVPYLNRSMAAELRTKMYGIAKEKARELYGKEVQPALQRALERELRKLLRKQVPGKRIDVVFDS